jgi:hypothetical protein
MSLRIPDRTRRHTPLTAVIGAAVVFTILLVLVRLQQHGCPRVQLLPTS